MSNPTQTKKALAMATIINRFTLHDLEACEKKITCGEVCDLLEIRVNGKSHRAFWFFSLTTVFAEVLNGKLSEWADKENSTSEYQLEVLTDGILRSKAIEITHILDGHGPNTRYLLRHSTDFNQVVQDISSIFIWVLYIRYLRHIKRVGLDIYLNFIPLGDFDHEFLYWLKDMPLTYIYSGSMHK